MNDQQRDENAVEMIDLDLQPAPTSPAWFSKSMSKLAQWKQSARIRATFFISTLLVCTLVLSLVLGLRLPALSFLKQASAPSHTAKTPVIPDARNFISAQIANGIVYIKTPNDILSARQATTGKELWRLKAGRSDLFEAINQVMYRLTCPPRGNCTLEARNALNGMLLWVRQLLPPAAAPLMGDSSVIYFHAYDGTLFALDSANGKILWQYATHTPAPLISSIAGDTIALFAQDVYLHVLRSSDGTQLFSYQPGAGQFPYVDNNTIYYQPTSTTVTARSLNDGHLLWQYTTGKEVFSLWGAQDNRVYLEDDTQQGILALNGTTGKLLWRYNTPLNTGAAGPIIQNGIVYAPLQSSAVAGLSASNGSLLWQQVISPFQYGPIAAGDVICLGQNNSIQALGNDGTIKWIYTTHNLIEWYPEESNGILLVKYLAGNNAFDVIRASDGTVLWQYAS